MPPVSPATNAWRSATSEPDVPGSYHLAALQLPAEAHDTEVDEESATPVLGSAVP